MKQNIVYFDGVCGLCNKFVDFLIRRDKKNQLLFAPLQGETAAARLNLPDAKNFDTVIFENESGTFYKSDAALRIIVLLGGIWKIAYLGFLFPKFFRNFVYDRIANNRYHFFGKKEACRIPSKEERMKFLP